MSKMLNTGFSLDDNQDADIMDTTKVVATDYKTKMEYFINNYGVSIDIPGFYI